VYGPVSSGSKEGLMAGACENGSESLGTIKSDKFLDKVSDY
jgi:hypothetical protein